VKFTPDNQALAILWEAYEREQDAGNKAELLAAHVSLSAVCDAALRVLGQPHGREDFGTLWDALSNAGVEE